MLLLETEGHHNFFSSSCYRVDLTNGKAALLAEGRMLAISPDGCRVAIYSPQRVGPYKRNDVFVAPLQIFSLTGRYEKVTDPFTELGFGGDWATAKR